MTSGDVRCGHIMLYYVMLSGYIMLIDAYCTLMGSLQTRINLITAESITQHFSFFFYKNHHFQFQFQFYLTGCTLLSDMMRNRDTRSGSFIYNPLVSSFKIVKASVKRFSGLSETCSSRISNTSENLITTV